MPTPALDPPGAGLPWWELLAARYVVFPLACRREWAASAAEFQAEGRAVLAVWDALPPDRLSERVLIPRISGIEDSSRHWSAATTVEHLNIVGTGLRRLIAGLRRGELPARPASVAAVKPTGDLAPEGVRAAFELLLADAAADERAEPPIPRGVGPRFAHPWFGPIDAHQWHCLLGMHQGIHRRQMERIERGLKSP